MSEPILAYLEDGPHGGETIVLETEDGSAPAQLDLEEASLRQPYDESSLRHSVPTAVVRYCLATDVERERGGYVYRLVREE
jgi:hypothetical protein